MSSQDGSHQKMFFQGNFFSQNSAGEMANCIIADIVKYLTDKLLVTHIFFH